MILNKNKQVDKVKEGIIVQINDTHMKCSIQNSAKYIRNFKVSL